MKRISMSIRDPIWDAVEDIRKKEDRSQSEMAAILVEEALLYRQNIPVRGVARPRKPIYASPSISSLGVETYDLSAED